MKTRRLRTRRASLKGHIWPANSIVYICGANKVKFGPSDKDLGGSEQAVVQLSKCWAQQGKHVTVFGNVKEGIKDGVDYRDRKSVV